MPSPGKETKDGEFRENRPPTKEFPKKNEIYPVLWVGNLTVDTLDSDLMSLFGNHAVLDCVMTFSSRNFAFLYFMQGEEARAAKNDLQGALVRGNSIRIEFARPAKPCKQIWIGGISSSVTKEQLEGEFSKFGKVESLKFNRERNSALIDFSKVDDAAAALKSMNGKELGGEKLRVDYLRTSPPSRRDVSDYNDPRRGSFLDPHSRFAPEASRHEGPPSRVLLIRHPPSVQITEQMLFNAMVMFGEVDHIRTLPAQCTAIVEFRTLDEARRAKEGLVGRLFNDPRIQILYSVGDPALQPKDGPPFRPGPQHDPFFGDHRFGMTKYSHRAPLMGQAFTDDLAHNRANFSRQSPDRGPKRTRIEGSPVVDGLMMGAPHPYGPGSPVGPRRPRDHCWRGVIAKGGTPVCHARCIPIGKGMESPLPEVVNCSARTGLELLAKHYEEAEGFDIVFFLPDSEEDFASYTEFLQYLRLNNRAGVAKLDDGTTLFLVPPSDFLSRVLKVSGPERLYGVVLKIPSPVGAHERQQMPRDLTPHIEFSHAQPSTAAPTVGYGAPAEAALTPELMATLAAVIPSSVAPPSVHEPQPLASSGQQYFNQNSAAAAAAQIRAYGMANSYPVPQAGVEYGYGGGPQVGQQSAIGQQGAEERVQGPAQLSSAEGETDKNQRYQSTLQLAANLLLQIQQQQKQATPHQ